MALDKQSLKSAIKSALQGAQDVTNANDGAEYIAERLANAIDSFVKTGSVSFTPGTITGIAPSGGGAITSGAGSEGTIG